MQSNRKREEVTKSIHVTPDRASTQQEPFWPFHRDTNPEEMVKPDGLDDDLDKFLRDIFGISQERKEHEIIESLAFDGISSWISFRRLQPEAIDGLTKKANAKQRVPIGTFASTELKVLTRMIRKKIEENPEVGRKIESYTVEEYEDYLNKNLKEMRTRASEKIEEGKMRPSNPINTNLKSRAEKALDNWERKRLDKTNFDILKEDSKYKLWKEKFVAEVKVQGLERMIDPNLQTKNITDPYDKELYQKQSNYFWTVLDYALKNPISELLLGKHRDTSDARTAFLAIDEKMKGKIAQMYNVGELMDTLRDLHISSFRGTRMEFLSHWFETLRQLNKLADKEDKLSYLHVRSQLMRAINTDVDLMNSFTELKEVKDRDVALVNLMDHLMERATLYDGRDGAAGSTDKQRIASMAHRMGYRSQDNAMAETLDFLANRTQQRNRRGPSEDVKLPEELYRSFTREDKIRWRELSDEAKRNIVALLTPAATRQTYHTESTGQHQLTFDEHTTTASVLRDLESSTKATLDILTVLKTNLATNDETQSTAASSISSLTRPPLSKSESTTPPKTKTDSSLPLKSSLGAGNPSRIMTSQTETESIQEKIDRIVSFHGTNNDFRAVSKHHLFYDNENEEINEPDTLHANEYSVSKRTVKPKQTMALIDRGANGCVAGEDCTWIGGPTVDRRVHITGMDDHQLTDVPIGTVGAYVVSNRGPVICIFHETAYIGRHQSIISALQLEHYRNKVDDRVEQLGGGQQITTADGYNFPLSIVNGLAFMQMRPFTTKEYNTLPHVIMTSEMKWEPRTYDNYVDPDSKEYRITKPEYLHLLPHEDYDVKGDYIGSHHTQQHDDTSFWYDESVYQHNEAIARCAYAARTRAKAKAEEELEWNENSNKLFVCENPRTHLPTESDYERLKPYFAWIPTKLIKATFDNSTQFGFTPTSPDGNLFKRWKSPNPAMNVFRLQDELLTDKIHSNTESIEGGYKDAQLFFGRKSHIIHVEPLSRKDTFLRALQNFVRKWGAPLKLIADHIAYHTSFQVLDYLRILNIQLWFSEAYYQHQNPFERRYQTFKRIVNRTMDRTGSPPELWFLCIQYVAYVLNRVSDPTLNNRQPIFLATGTIGDISAITTFKWYEPVYYKKDTKQISFPDTGEGFGYFVGIAETVGHSMTYRIWNPDTKRVIERSSVRSALDARFPNKRASPNDINISENYGEGLNSTVRPTDFIFSKPLRKQITSAVTPDSKNYGESEYLDESSQSVLSYDTTQLHFAEDGTPMVILVDDDGQPKIDSEGNVVMIPGKTPKELKGITFKKRQEDGSTLRARVLGPVESNLKSKDGIRRLQKFRVRYDKTQQEDTIAYNDIMNYLHRDQIQEDGQVWKFRRIVAHRGPLTPNDRNYKNSRYNVNVEWENGEITEEPLNWMIKEDPVATATYARDNDLLQEEGWRSLRPIAKRAKLLKRLINQARLRSYRTAPKYMYGYQVPRDYEEAMALDKQNGNTRWADATKLEMAQLNDYKVFIDKGVFSRVGIPAGFKKIRVHLVFAVKHDGRHKARLVADGHLTDLPLNSVYAGVVSIRGLRMVLFLAELNGLEAYATDIGNAYLEATTQEKVCIHAGPEFGDLEGHLLIIYKALYGLRSSGKQFGDLLAACLKELGFLPSKAEPQIFLRENEGIYEYIATYVDDLCLVMRDPASFLEVLQSKPYDFKLKGSGPMSFHLGCGFERDSERILTMNPRKYIEKISVTYEQLFGTKLGHKPKSPLEDGDHPELDTSEFLDEEDTQKYQSLIGSLQWLITLGRWDIQTAVMTLSSFRSNPRKGHLDRAKRVCAYVNRFKHYALKFRVDEPDLSALNHAIHVDWSKDVYEEFEEEIPHDIPKPLGKRVTLIHWFDANLMHDVLSGKAVTGCVHFLNKTPIMWHSKKQATTETATYGAEFCAGRTCIEQIIDLRNTLRYLGVPLNPVSYMFGDNKSMIDSATFPYARLHKRHNILSFHFVRSMIARGFIALTHVNSKDNLADVVTKHWGYNSVRQLLKPVFFYNGDPNELYVDDET